MKTKWLMILLIISFATSAQNYQYIPMPTDSTVWSEVYRWDAFSPWKNYRWAVFGDDTVWQGKTYSKVYKLHTIAYDKTQAHVAAAMREEDKRVYIVPFECLYDSLESWYLLYGVNGYPFVNHEFMQYDFNLQIGEIIPRDYTFIYDPGFPIYVYDVDTIQLKDGFWRRKIKSEYESTVSFTEGFGSGWGLLFPYGSIFNTGIWCIPVCFKIKGIEIYHHEWFESCYPFNEIKKKEGQNISIAPNPVNDFLIVNSNGNTVDQIDIFNFFGENMLSALPLQTNCQVDVGYLHAGIYFVQIKVRESLYRKTILKL